MHLTRRYHPYAMDGLTGLGALVVGYSAYRLRRLTSLANLIPVLGIPLLQRQIEPLEMRSPKLASRAWTLVASTYAGFAYAELFFAYRDYKEMFHTKDFISIYAVLENLSLAGCNVPYGVKFLIHAWNVRMEKTEKQSIAHLPVDLQQFLLDLCALENKQDQSDKKVDELQRRFNSLRAYVSSVESLDLSFLNATQRINISDFSASLGDLISRMEALRDEEGEEEKEVEEDDYDRQSALFIAVFSFVQGESAEKLSSALAISQEQEAEVSLSEKLAEFGIHSDEEFVKRKQAYEKHYDKLQGEKYIAWVVQGCPAGEKKRVTIPLSLKLTRYGKTIRYWGSRLFKLGFDLGRHVIAVVWAPIPAAIGAAVGVAFGDRSFIPFLPPASSFPERLHPSKYFQSLVLETVIGGKLRIFGDSHTWAKSSWYAQCEDIYFESTVAQFQMKIPFVGGFFAGRRIGGDLRHRIRSWYG